MGWVWVCGGGCSLKVVLPNTPVMKSQEVSVSQKKGGARLVMGWENRFLCRQIFAVINLVGLGSYRTPGQMIDMMTS